MQNQCDQRELWDIGICDVEQQHQMGTTFIEQKDIVIQESTESVH